MVHGVQVKSIDFTRPEGASKALLTDNAYRWDDDAQISRGVADCLASGPPGTKVFSDRRRIHPSRSSVWLKCGREALFSTFYGRMYWIYLK